MAGYDTRPHSAQPFMSASDDQTIGQPPALIAYRSFALFCCARTATVAAYMMQTVAVGWQIYDMTSSALDLGLVGLVQFFPFVALAPVIGQIADRYDRRMVARTCQVVKALCALALAAGTLAGWLNRDAILTILFVTGTARAIAASATANQTAIICGPALGGLIYSFGPTTVYAICRDIHRGKHPGQPGPARPGSRSHAGDAADHARRLLLYPHRPVVLGAISLDLFVMLMGSITALLPIFARDLLETGPWGLGLLRSAPAIGALAISIVLARSSLDRRVGPILFVTTAVFGLSILVFALSTSLILSIVALTIYGASDAISVVIRHSLVQTRTPNDMLGRVMAINSMLTGPRARSANSAPARWRRHSAPSARC